MKYGQIISESRSKPMADQEEFVYWGKVTELMVGSKVSTGVLVCHARDRIVENMERHVRTPEILVALKGDGVVCMAEPEPKSGADRIEGIAAFIIPQGVAFVLRTATWHWIPFPLGAGELKFLVLFASGTEDDDLEIKKLDEPVTIGV
jgi:hypothetical protein